MKKNIFLSVVGLAAFAVLVLPVSAQKPADVGKPAEKPLQAQTAQANPNANKGQVNIPTSDAAETTQPATEKNVKGQATAESHRSAVASFVQSLLAVADREGGIGAQVKVVAQQQKDSQEAVAGEINAVENRSPLKTFFLGTDYKNVGALRSEMVKTRNDIAQLTRLAAKAENPEDKTALETQIQSLEQEAKKIDTFITDNESQFSLFGWAVKLFQ
ncbi:MAG: hypothetical protein Q8P68_01365 [Candidatus Peregrinibacteria bacterium]|nr:hypothetical protein [Candidatus Peregrinibacteria bacterium]